MNAQKANLINAISLMAMSTWAYFSSLTPSVTALIPLVFGVVLLALNNGIKFENKAQSHVAVICTLLVLLALTMPFRGALKRDDSMAMFRIGIMMVTSALSLFYFIMSFRAARKARQNK